MPQDTRAPDAGVAALRGLLWRMRWEQKGEIACGVSVDDGHALCFVGPVRRRVLDDAEGIDPEVLVAEGERDSHGFFVDIRGFELVARHCFLKGTHVGLQETELLRVVCAPHVAQHEVWERLVFEIAAKPDRGGSDFQYARGPLMWIRNCAGVEALAFLVLGKTALEPLLCLGDVV